MQINERREDVLALLTKGLKGYEIANELGVDASTVSRDIQHLFSQSQNYLRKCHPRGQMISDKGMYKSVYGQNVLIKYLLIKY